MIQNQNELAETRKQLAHIEKALASLREDILPKNKRNFEVLSEGYVDQIEILQAEIDAYLGRTNGTIRDPAAKPVEQRTQ
jgi:hypothetical protein